MPSLAEAESRVGDVVRRAGGAIFGVEKSPSVESRQDEKLQIGTTDGFVEIAVSLNYPNIEAVLRERTAIFVKHAEELKCSRLVYSSSSNAEAPVGRFEHHSNPSPQDREKTEPGCHIRYRLSGALQDQTHSSAAIRARRMKLSSVT